MKNPRALSLLFIANSISGFAQGVSMLAIPWYFASIINRPGIFGIMYAAVTFFSIFWGLYFGTYIDRYPRKNIFLAITASGFLVLGGVALSGFILGEVPLALIMVVFASTMLIYNVHYPTLYAFGQELTEKANYRKVNTLIEIIGQSTNMIAGAIGAILLSGTNEDGIFNLLGWEVDLPFIIERWKMHEIFLMDCATYLVAMVLISFIKYTPAVNLKIDTAPILQRMKAGIRFLMDRKLLFVFGVCSYSIFVVLLVELHFLLPMYVDNHLQLEGDIYSSAEVYYTFGALLIGLTIGRLLGSVSELKTIILFMLITTVVMAICAFTRSVTIFFFVSFMMGITNSGTRIVRITYLFDNIPNNIIGRANSVLHIINVLMRTAMILLFSLPFFARGSNVKWAYLISGIFVLLFVFPLVINYQKLAKGEQ